MPYPSPTPSGTPVWSRVGIALAAVAGTLVTAGIVFAALEATEVDEGLTRATASTAAGLMLVALAVVIVRGLPEHTRRMLHGDRRGAGRAIAAGAGIGLLITAGSVAIVAGGAHVDSTARRRLEELSEFPDLDPLAVIVVAIGLVILAPLGEEILFRGVILRSLALRFGFWASVIGSSILFAASHIDAWMVWPRALGLLFAGILLALAYRRFGLIGSIAAHATVNLVALLAIVAGAGEGDGRPAPSQDRPQRNAPSRAEPTALSRAAPYASNECAGCSQPSWASSVPPQRSSRWSSATPRPRSWPPRHSARAPSPRSSNPPSRSTSATS